MPAISKITAKGQTTVPQEVRAALKSSAEARLPTSTTCRRSRGR